MVLNNLTKPQSVYDYLNILESLSLSLLCSSKQKQRVYSYCMAICSNKDKYLPCIYEAAELTKTFFESPLTLRWSNFVDKNIEIQSSPSDRKRNARMNNYKTIWVKSTEPSNNKPNSNEPVVVSNIYIDDNNSSGIERNGDIGDGVLPRPDSGNDGSKPTDEQKIELDRALDEYNKMKMEKY